MTYKLLNYGIIGFAFLAIFISKLRLEVRKLQYSEAIATIVKSRAVIVAEVQTIFVDIDYAYLGKPYSVSDKNTHSTREEIYHEGRQLRIVVNPNDPSQCELAELGNSAIAFMARAIVKFTSRRV